MKAFAPIFKAGANLSDEVVDELIKIGDSWVELPDGTFRVWTGKDWVRFNPGAKGGVKY